MEDVEAEWTQWVALTVDWTASVETTIDWLESQVFKTAEAEDDGKQVCVIDQLEMGGRKHTETQGILGNGVLCHSYDLDVPKIAVEAAELRCKCAAKAKT